MSFDPLHGDSGVEWTEVQRCARIGAKVLARRRARARAEGGRVIDEGDSDELSEYEEGDFGGGSEEGDVEGGATEEEGERDDGFEGSDFEDGGETGTDEGGDDLPPLGAGATREAERIAENIAYAQETHFTGLQHEFRQALADSERVDKRIREAKTKIASAKKPGNATLWKNKLTEAEEAEAKATAAQEDTWQKVEDYANAHGFDVPVKPKASTDAVKKPSGVKATKKGGRRAAAKSGKSSSKGGKKGPAPAPGSSNPPAPGGSSARAARNAARMAIQLAEARAMAAEMKSLLGQVAGTDYPDASTIPTTTASSAPTTVDLATLVDAVQGKQILHVDSANKAIKFAQERAGTAAQPIMRFSTAEIALGRMGVTSKDGRDEVGRAFAKLTQYQKEEVEKIAKAAVAGKVNKTVPTSFTRAERDAVYTGVAKLEIALEVHQRRLQNQHMGDAQKRSVSAPFLEQDKIQREAVARRTLHVTPTWGGDDEGTTKTGKYVKAGKGAKRSRETAKPSECWNCLKPGHRAAECPRPPRKVKNE